MAPAPIEVKIDPAEWWATQRLLDELPAKLRNKALRPGLRDGAKTIAVLAKTLCSVGETKRLRRSIKVRAAKRKKKDVQSFLVTTGLSSNLFSGQAYYGGVVHYGSQKNKHPNPFLERAADLGGPAAITRIQARIIAELEKVKA